MEVKKEKDENKHYRYEFIKNNKRFEIKFLNNGDLYWTFMDYDEMMGRDKVDYGTFTISIDDNYELFVLFEGLFIRVKNARVSPSDFDPIKEQLAYFSVTDKEWEDICSRRKDELQINRMLKQSDTHQKLFDGEKITWVSDDGDYEDDQLVQISKQGDNFVLEFARREKPDKDKKIYNSDLETSKFSIRFCNSGSSYKPFNIVFMDMYHALSRIKFDKKAQQQVDGQMGFAACFQLK